MEYSRKERTTQVSRYGRSYLPGLSQGGRTFGVKRLCKMFGVDYPSRERDLWLMESLFAQLAPGMGWEEGLLPIASAAFLLRGIGGEILSPAFGHYPGEIIRTHPLKQLSSEENLLLSQLLDLLGAGCKSAGSLEKFCAAMELSPLGETQDKAVELAALAQLAATLLRWNPGQVTASEGAPYSFSLALKKPVNIRKRCRLQCPLWELRFGESFVEWRRMEGLPEGFFGAEAASPLVKPSFRGQLRGYVIGQVEIIRVLVRKRESFDEERIHDIRVAFRGLSSVLRYLRPYLDAKTYGRVYPGLKEARGKMGSARDADVVLHLFCGYVKNNREEETGEEVFSFVKDMEAKREEARRAAESYLRSPKQEEVLQRLSQHAGALSRPALGENGQAALYRPGDVMAVTVRDAFGALMAYDEWLYGQEVGEGLLHGMRIAFKRLRYLLEFFREEAGKPGERAVRICKKAQDLLGAMHDSLTAAEAAAKFLESLPNADEDGPEVILLEEFIRSCEEGMALYAQEFLLYWSDQGKEELESAMIRLLRGDGRR